MHAPRQPDPNKLLPPELAAFMTITEVDHADFILGEVFRRKFDDTPPDVPHHLVALYRRGDGGFEVISYSHMRAFGDIYLSGGSLTLGDAVRRMDPAHAATLKAAGGPWAWILRYAFARYHDDCQVFFGYSANAHAVAVSATAGFEPTEHPCLFAHWHKPLHPNIRRALIAKAHALGEF
jgi:hypothetical protein